jgi:16S rRNA (cytosine967-C5)-methyltransferase
VEELLPLQARLLEAMLPLLAPGGRLVYATCTIHPAENGAQVNKLLQDHADFLLESEQQCWPNPDGGDGFYTAVITARITAPA